MRTVRALTAKALARGVIGAALLMIAGLLAAVAPPAVAAPAPAPHGLPAPKVARPHVTLSPVPFRTAPDRDQTRGRAFTATRTRLPSAWSGSAAMTAPRGGARSGAV